MLAFVPKKVIIYHILGILIYGCSTAVFAGLPVRNMNPFSVYVGIPEIQSARKLLAEQQVLSFNTNINSHFVQEKDETDALVIDGESYVGEFVWQQGFDGWEGGVLIPYISYQNGFLDAAIINWHNAFHLPGDNREGVQDDQLMIRYINADGFLLKEPAEGAGDIQLNAGLQITDEINYQHAMQITLKLPTGDYRKGLGSGGTDLALYTTHAWQKNKWQTTLQLGLIGMEEPEVLTIQRRQTAYFGSVALDYAVVQDWMFTLQYDMHSALYSETRQPALGNAFWLSVGVRNFKETWAWHFVVIEDAAVHTAPDIGFQLGLQFGDVAYTDF